jgi:hypothetical protein
MPSPVGAAIRNAKVESACELHPRYSLPDPLLNWHVRRIHLGRRAMFEHDHREGSPRFKPGGWETYRNGQPQHVAEMVGDIALRDFPPGLARETTKAEHRWPSEDVPPPSAGRRLFRLRSAWR